MADPHKNFAFGTVLTAPSPATSGTSLVLGSGQGALFPQPSTDGAFNAVIWPASSQPSAANAEIIRCTARSTDTLGTIVRAQESSSARTVVVGDQVALVPSAKVFQDIDALIASITTSTVLCAAPTGVAATDNANFAAGLTAAAGGTLQLRDGTYNLTTAMTVASNTTIVGDKATVVNCTVSGVMFTFTSKVNIVFRGVYFNLLGTSSTFALFDGTFGCVFDGVQVWGTHSVGSPQAAEIGLDFVNNSGDNFFIGGCEFGNLGRGARTASVFNYLIGCKFTNCQYGLYGVNSFSAGMIVSDCVFASTPGGTTISQVYIPNAGNRYFFTNTDMEGATNTVVVGSGTLFDGPTVFAMSNCHLAGTTKILDIESAYGCSLVGVSFTADPSATPTTLTINATGAPDNGFAAGLVTNVAADSGVIAASLFPAGWNYLGKSGSKLSGTLAMNAVKITGLANGSSSSDAAAFGQIPVIATSVPIIDGVAAIGASGKWADSAHVHPTDTSRAALASPTFTGTPAAPTPSANDNSTKIATTAYADAAVAKRARNQAWAPSGAISETFPRDNRGDVCALVSTGMLNLAGGLLVPAGVTVTNITFVSSSTGAGTPTHWWFCLVDAALNVLAKTTDQTTTAWATNTAKTLALTAPYTPTVDTPVYAGFLMTATTVITFVGSVVSAGGTGHTSLTPKLGGQSTSGLTTPASLGATAGAITAGDLAYAYLS